MKSNVIALSVLAAVMIFVSLNTFFVMREIDLTISEVDGLVIEETTGDGSDAEAAERLYREFLRREKVISLTVSHDDLTNIETNFAEMCGALRAREYGQAKIAKSRLTDALRHLRRLSGITIDSII